MKILVFGAHPDDVELSVGGIVARHAAPGPRGGNLRFDGG